MSSMFSSMMLNTATMESNSMPSGQVMREDAGPRHPLPSSTVKDAAASYSKWM